MKKVRVLELLVITGLMLLTYLCCTYKPRSKGTSIQYIKHCIISTKILTLQSLYEELIKLKVRHIDIVMQQACLESGWLKSSLCLKYNNLFGFQIDSKHKLHFTSWIKCCEFYANWQKMHYNKGNYYILLSMIYCKDTNYTNLLKHTRWQTKMLNNQLTKQK